MISASARKIKKNQEIYQANANKRKPTKENQPEKPKKPTTKKLRFQSKIRWVKFGGLRFSVSNIKINQLKTTNDNFVGTTNSVVMIHHDIKAPKYPKGANNKCLQQINSSVKAFTVVYK